MRQTEEWIGRHDDEAIPPRVRLRVIERQDYRCAITGRHLRPGDPVEFDHIIALCNGGLHAESNLQAILGEAHKAKTAADVRIKAKNASVAKKHWGLSGKKRIVPGSRASPWKKTLHHGWVRRDAPRGQEG